MFVCIGQVYLYIVVPLIPPPSCALMYGSMGMEGCILWVNKHRMSVYNIDVHFLFLFLHMCMPLIQYIIAIVCSNLGGIGFRAPNLKFWWV